MSDIATAQRQHGAPPQRLSRTYAKDYRSALLRRETKDRLHEFRQGLDNTDLNQERRLITAAVELCMSRADLRADWFRQVADVVQRDIRTQLGGDENNAAAPGA